MTGLVKFGDGSTVNIKGKGTVSFRCKNGEEKFLRDVYFIPTLRNNIISLGQMSENNNKVILEGEAVRQSVYLLNRLPTRVLSGKTPYEA